MTIQEAIERLEVHKGWGYREGTMTAIDMAISALKAIQQYREIGTVEECKELASMVTTEKKNVLGQIVDEWKEYIEIETVEECRKAVEKQKAKKCDVTKDNFRIYYKCPTCSHCLRVEYNHGSWMGKKSKNCSKCGQAIQWDENLEGMEDD